MEYADRRDVALLLLVVTASLGARALFALDTDVFQDEVVYWWQAGMGTTFVPHPPVTALAMRLGLALLGRGVAGLRMASLLAGTGVILVAYALARQMAGRRAALWAAGLVAACPLMAALGAVATPDAPLLFFWLLFVWVARQAVRTGRATWWAAAGGVLAVGLYTKYMMILVLPSLGLAMLVTAEGRRALRRAAPWIALSAGLLAFAVPFLIWDGRHGWPTLQYHLHGRHVLKPELRSTLIYVSAHVGAISPVLFGAVLWSVARWWRRWRRGDDRGAWIVSFFVVPVAFFLAPSVLTARVMIRVHWDSMAYTVGLVGLACLMHEAGVRGVRLRRLRRWACAGTCLAAATVAVGVVLCVWPALPVAAGMGPPTKRILGWRELGERVQALRAGWDGPRPFVLAESFRTILPIAFYLDDREDVYSLWHERNVRYGLTEQMHEWRIDEAALAADCTGRAGIYVHEFRFSSHSQSEDPMEHIYRFTPELEKLGDYYVEVGGRRLKHYGLFRVRDLRARRVHP